jgi:hypothetical protein
MSTPDWPIVQDKTEHSSVINWTGQAKQGKGGTY